MPTPRAASLLLLVSAFALACGDDDGGRDAGAMDGGAACATAAECDDGVYCNGLEQCAPGDPAAAASGCVAGAPPCGEGACDEEADRCEDVCPDADGDGFEDGRCGGEDCDDMDPLAYPGAAEICDPDDRDEDCDPSTFGRADRDGDGQLATRCCNPQPDGVVLCGADCNDALPAVFLGATEICDRYDNDCDGEIDEGVLVSGYVDADGDRHGDPESVAQACPGAAHFSLYADDCDDGDATVFGGRPEECNGRDDDCDGAVDEAVVDLTFYRDGDGDGFGDPRGETRTACAAPEGFALLPLDCDDGDAERSPASEERCNGLDDDCDGVAAFRVGPADLEDDDGDGVGDAACGGGDCADDDPRVGGGLEEVLDGVDNDCDGVVDDRCVMSAFYVDEDGDGFGTGDAMIACEPMGRAARDGDCADDDAAVRPGAVERCNGVDDDCDGATDEFVDAECGLPGAIGRCEAGVCEVALCARGWLDCDEATAGCETSAYDTGSCGACDAACESVPGGVENALPACVAQDGTPPATCGFACADGYGDCDGDPANGCERPLGDPANCGGCDVLCAVPLNSAPLCEGGRCTSECLPGFTSCDAAVDGCETATGNDPENCGACGNVCPSGVCVASRCVTHPYMTGTEDFVAPRNATFASGVFRYGRFEVPADSLLRLTGGTGVLEIHAEDEVVINGTVNVSGGNATAKGGSTGISVTSGLGCGDSYGGLGEPGQRGVGATVCGWGGTNGGGSGGDRREPGGGGGGFGGGGGGRWSAVGDGGDGGGPYGGNGGGADIALGGWGGRATPACYGGGNGSGQPGTLPNAGAGGGGSIGQAAADDLAAETTFEPGSAGGGAAGDELHAGGGGGGGGGALRITSATRIHLMPRARLLADGGDGGAPGGGGGSGGIIELVAPEILIEGGALLSARGGLGAGPGGADNNLQGGDGGLGRIHISVDPSRCVIAGDTSPPTTLDDRTPIACRGLVTVYPN